MNHKLTSEQREFLHRVQTFKRMMDYNPQYIDTIKEILSKGEYTDKQQWMLKEILKLLTI